MGARGEAILVEVEEWLYITLVQMQTKGKKMEKKLKVLFLSPEAIPFAKTGGLADVAGSLPEALKRQGVDVRMALPLYATVRKANINAHLILKNLKVPLGKEKLVAQVLESETKGGVPVYLIEREDLYDRPNLYGNAFGDYYDNLERFTFFAHASLLISENIAFKPDLIHCHDWQTGLIPALIKGPYKDHKTIGGTPVVFTIHNLGYQGLFPPEKLIITGLSKKEYFHPEGLEFWGKICLLKAGIVYSEAITTVSPTYAKEIQTPQYGMGMDGILRKRRESLFGILNGVDYCIWDPAQDSHLPANYSLQNMAGKYDCKRSLIKEMNLDPSLENRPLLGMISRLDAQKGLDLLVEILNDILALNVGLVILGTGDKKIQEAIRKVAASNPGQVGLKIGFDEPLAHRIIAGVDIFLIPSRYEPCGLTQMYSLKYGTVPVVRATGGLEDTIVPFDSQTGSGNGFKFGPYEPKAFLSAIRKAIELFHDSKSWEQIKANGMKADFSWDRSAKTYINIYQSIIKGVNSIHSG
ncbi:MAG: glycogen synthase GlgA [Deltaproteobacteria bacterium]|nr:MAG: glycogen synthase GlgA [Deltaproteobacteria bacterium]